MDPDYAVPFDGRAATAGGRLRLAILLVAAVLIGQAVVVAEAELVRSGGYSAPAVGLVVVATGLVIAAMFLPDRHGGPYTYGVGRMVLAVGVVAGLWRLPWLEQYLRFPSFRPTVRPFVLLAGLSAVLSAVLIVRRPRAVLPACFPILVVAFVLMGAFYLGLAPDPKIDVYRFHQFGCDALLHGRDPFAITIPSPYETRAHYYAPGVVVGGRILCGYCYPPLTLLLSVPAYLWAGDVRYAHLLAWATAAVVVAYGVPRRAGGGDRPGVGPAVLLLLLPGVFHLIENAWTEPFLVLLVAVTTVLAMRGWLRSAAVTAGLLLASKQYAPLAAPACLLLVARPVTVVRWVATAVIAGLVLTVPFVVWNPAAFYRSQTVLNFGVVRYDSLAVLPMILRHLGVHRLLLAWPLAAAVAAGGLVLWRAPRTPAGFAAGFALVCLCVFLASPISFGNYYALPAGALCVAAAAGDDSR